MDDDLGVGLGGESLAVSDEGCAQDVRVFDDAVMHEREAPVGTHLGVSVSDRGAPVGGPPRVPDAGNRVDGTIRVDFLDQVHELADRAAHVQAAVGGKGDTRRVITAILQACQPAEDYLTTALGRLTSNMSNNSAHASNSNTSAPTRHHERVSLHVTHVCCTWRAQGHE